jgi:hypothetical protein
MSMSRPYGLLALLAGTALALAGCQEAPPAGGSSVADPPAVVEPAAGGGPARVVLTGRAEQEVGLATGVVGTAPDGTATIPYAAVVYDGEGSSWAFVPVDPHTYQRVPVAVTRVVGDQATLTSGPPAGTEVVTVGAAFLVGAEAQISGGE